MAKKEEPRPTAATSASPARHEGGGAGGEKPTRRERTPQLDLRGAGAEHRQFPRALLSVPVSLTIGDERDRRFAAKLPSVNVSVSGVFVESTFFLPLGTILELSFQLEPDADPVLCRAEVVRDERPSARTGEGRSGMGLRFLEFHAQTEVTLARLFLAERLRAFAQTYLASERARQMEGELDRVIDALAAWELQKVNSPEDPWRGNSEA